MNTQIAITLILGIIASIIAAINFRYNWILAKDKMNKELFKEFNERYEKLNNYLYQIAQEFSTIELLEKAQNSKELQQKVIDYFSLCAEEFYWYHHKNRIGTLIWKSWQSGMNYWYNEVPAIKSLWEEEVKSNGKESYYITNKVEFFIDSNNLSKV